MAGAYEKLHNALKSDKEFPWLKTIASALRKCSTESSAEDQMLAHNEILASELMRSVFQRIIIDKIQRPSPITVEDLVTIAQEQLSGVAFDEPMEEWIGAANRFVRRALCLLGDYEDPREGPSISLGTWACESDEAEYLVEPFEDTEGDNIVWCLGNESENDDWQLRLHAEHDDKIGLYHVSAYFSGPCSERAMSSVSEENAPVITSIAHSVALSATTSERALAKPYSVLGYVTDLTLDDETLASLASFDKDFEGFGDTPAVVAQPQEPVVNLSSPATLTYLSQDGGHWMFNSCWDAYLVGDTEGQEIDRRIRNAVLLLAEADRIKLPAVRLALCFSAIEALCCKDTKDETTKINAQIRKYVPHLMCPAGIGRSARGDVLYDLYERRSRILHGSRVHAAHAFAEISRRIAAGVLRAVTRWRSVRIRNGNGSDWNDLVTQLDDLAFKNGSAIPDSLDLSELLPKRLPPD